MSVTAHAISLTTPLDAAQVAVVIPARNEAASIRDIALACMQQVKHVIVIDDASSDDTREQLKDLPITLLHSDTQLGKGGALAWGFRKALELDAHAVITLDGDGQHDPTDIPQFIAAANRYPQHLVLGARLKHQQRAPRRRLIANRIADFWISWAAGQPIRDSQCGHRLYPTELLREVTARSSVHFGFVFESEILIESARHRFDVVVVPIESRYPPHARASHFHPARDIWRITKMVSGKLLLRGFYLHGLINSLVRRPVVV